MKITGWKHIGLTCLMLGLGIVHAQTLKNSKKPNILIIFTDDQGYHDVSYYGTEDIQTPHIDAIRNDGMQFDYFYTNSPVCAPTRASLMSGRYPDHVGVPGLVRSNPKNNWGYLNPETVLLPAMLKKGGYHTAHIGKWNLGLEHPNLPNDHGFDYFHGWLEDMMDDYITHRRHGKNYMRLNEGVIDPKGHATDLFTEWSVNYIQEREKKEDPFFLYLAYNAPHFPVQPPKEWVEKVKKREPGLPEKRANLIAFIEHLDDGIGQVINALKETGQYENTLIIFTSDNGGHLPDLANNGLLRDGKQSMYEGGLRVPTAISWPAKIKAGTSSDQVNLSMDIFPTLTEIAGVPLDHDINGRSFLSTLLGETMREEVRPLYFVRREGGTRYGGKAYHALRLGDWKLLQNSPFQPMELYNLKEDPYEKNNIIMENKEVFQKLNAYLMSHIQEGGKVPWQKPE
ncbi:sulfatase-like hydrolase/transferase [Cyclobacterium sp. 1_MG-2023]|uniref:sulfatase family protein n=1 Tax=Cyclobacterium sp. 1_MG-2023 TaxID=3062681 RepID=UPI0026E2154A|nr:sulfatase-like hydrolase/transferase [Cyclobacterium sp. 1_MG-2023]MDO6439112.1 sulfatase-like hydrolase/transferase [Cyclobacterium sp. 1_MG-2023]